MRPEVEALELEGYAALRGCSPPTPARWPRPPASSSGCSQATAERALLPGGCSTALCPPPKAYRLAVASRDPCFEKESEQEWYYRVRLLLDWRERHDGYLCTGGVPAVVRI